MLIRASGTRDWRKFFATDLKISLNGAEIKDVIEADDEAGYLVRYLRGDDGKLLEDGVRYVTERLEGTVTFTGTKRFSADDAKAAAQAKRDRRQARNNTIANRNAVRVGDSA